MVDYNFSRETFPVNKSIEQHSSQINDDDTLFECTILAGEILGVKCCDTVMSGDRDLNVDITYFQITPDPYSAKSENERKEYEAFNDYFYENYGKHKERCYFDTEHEAFYNIVKAWKIWNHILTENDKEKYRRIY